MDPMLLSFLMNLAVNYFTQFTGPDIKDFFSRVFKKKPQLEKDLLSIQNDKDLEEFFRKVEEVIDASAGTGSIEVDGAIVEAMKGIRFDHKLGTVTINGTTMKAPIIRTGGGLNAKGQTIIKDSELKTKGTSIKVEAGASIKITGDANIAQR